MRAGNYRNQSVNVHQFAMVPRADIPRSSFRMQKKYLTTIDGGDLVPVLVEEVLPGDTFNCKMTAFCRMATPLFLVLDNMRMESFFFFVPNRLTWTNWVRFMGEQDNPADSISFSIPQTVSAVGGFAVNSIFDYMGLPTVGQVGGGNTVSVNSLPLRAYNLIWNEWFRDENLQNSLTEFTGNGPDTLSSYSVQKRAKRHDYFTSCLPWPQKGGASVPLPLGTSAPVRTSATPQTVAGEFGIQWRDKTTNAAPGTNTTLMVTNAISSNPNMKLTNAAGVAGSGDVLYPANLYADLSSATAATINQIRQAFQIQRLLERDARGGTRYTELVRAHFGVISPDARLQRPEYLGGGSSPVGITPVPQTSNTPVSGTPQGNLAAIGTVLLDHHGFTQSFTEHGYIIGLINVRADLTYQQGLRRHWSRLTRYDYYFPVFAMLGEQAVLSKEIYCDGGANDNDVFGYQERWAEYRYLPSEITGQFKSTSASNIDEWHLAEQFGSRPVLNAAFISDKTETTFQRVAALGAASVNQQFLCDLFFDIKAARPMPLYSVPGMIDHF